MKQIYEFAACLFLKEENKEYKRAIHTICQDADEVWFIKAQGIKEKRRIVLLSTAEKDPILFEKKNGIYDKNCKIYLN